VKLNLIDASIPTLTSIKLLERDQFVYSGTTSTGFTGNPRYLLVNALASGRLLDPQRNTIKAVQVMVFHRRNFTNGEYSFRIQYHYINVYPFL
jgi:hypothetical protein